jgi:hypothetical protein
MHAMVATEVEQGDSRPAQRPGGPLDVSVRAPEGQDRTVVDGVAVEVEEDIHAGRRELGQ